MQRFWNRLVALREDVAFNCETLPENAAAIEKRFWNLLIGRDGDCRRWRKTIKEESGLHWAARDAVFDRFITSCQEAARNKRGWPKSQNELVRIAIPHRFTRGIPAHALFARDRRVWRFGLEPVAPWAYEGKDRRHTNARLTSGFFGVSKEAKVGFRTVLHRAFPPQTIAKEVSWLGKLHSVKGWQWMIAIRLEGVNRANARETLPACGLDMGWRVQRDYIRIGMLYDNDGHVAELRLPFSAPTSHTRRHALASGWRDILDMDRHIGGMVEDVKYRLAPLLPADLPDDVQRVMSQFGKVRQGGLVRILAGLERVGIAENAQALLRSWLAQNDRLLALRAALQDRLVGRRQWLYRNLAAFLARHYGTIAMKKELLLKALIEDNSNPEFALQYGHRYEHWAAIAELRRYITEAATKYGARLFYARSLWRTVTCHICGERAKSGKTLELVCPSGHRWDQDVNAAINLLSELEESCLLEKGATRSSPPLNIPAILKEVVVSQSS
jgi:hypothetical protein